MSYLNNLFSPFVLGVERFGITKLLSFSKNIYTYTSCTCIIICVLRWIKIVILVTGVLKNPEAIEELRGTMLEFAKDEGFHGVICCLDNGDDPIKEFIGASMMTLESKQESMPEVN